MKFLLKEVKTEPSFENDSYDLTLKGTVYRQDFTPGNAHKLSNAKGYVEVIPARELPKNFTPSEPFSFAKREQDLRDNMALLKREMKKKRVEVPNLVKGGEQEPLHKSLGFKIVGGIGKDEVESEDMEMLRELKAWDRDRSDMDTSIALLTFAKSMGAEFEANDLDVPEWLRDRVRSIAREVEERKRDYKVRELKSLEAKLASLADKELTTKDIAARIASLKKDLS